MYRTRQAFTLIELLVVIAIGAVLTAGSMAAISSIMGMGNMNGSTTEMEGVLEQARAYAMAKNTYVYVGLEEVAASQASGDTPQAVGVGRVAIGVAASPTGLAPDAAGASYPNITGQVQAIDKVKVLNGVHLGNLSQVTTGNMLRTTANTVLANDASSGTPQVASEVYFTWPVNTAAAPRYVFHNVIQFNPQGVASFQPSGTASQGQYIVPLIELGLQPAHGTSVIALSGGNFNCAALQIEGVTGRVQIYRP